MKATLWMRFEHPTSFDIEEYLEPLFKDGWQIARSGDRIANGEWNATMTIVKWGTDGVCSPGNTPFARVGFDE